MSNIVRVIKDKNFVVMDKTALQDISLSWKAKGIMAYMLSLPDDWTFYIEELVKHSTDGESSFRAGFKELRDRGYVKRIPIREGSRIVSWETKVYENPLLCGFQQVDNQHVGFLEVENRRLLSNDFELSNNNTKNIDSPESVVFHYYVSKNIIQHKTMTTSMKSKIKTALKNHGMDELKKIIDNYSTVLKGSQYFFNTEYTLEKLLRPKDLSQFGDEAKPLYNFLIDKSSQQVYQPQQPIVATSNPFGDMTAGE